MLNVRALSVVFAVCGAVACGGESKPANDPSTENTTGASGTTDPAKTASTDTSTPATTTPAADPNAKPADVTGTAPAATPATGNTAMNTAGTPADPEADKKLTAAVQKNLEGDKKLSAAAKTITIAANGAKVTLTGTVKSEAEKTAVAAKAKSTAGVTDVDNQLEVKSAAKKK